VPKTVALVDAYQGCQYLLDKRVYIFTAAV